jgi:hypothetical protein
MIAEKITGPSSVKYRIMLIGTAIISTNIKLKYRDVDDWWAGKTVEL